MSTFDVAIIGAGVTGLSAGYWLAKRGVKVVVLDKGRVAYEASSRAMGFQSLRGENPPEIPLAAAANDMWHSLDEELGYPTEWTASGRLWVALNEDDLRGFATTAAHWKRQNLPVDLIDVATTRALVPGLCDRIVGGLYTKRGGHANPQRTSQAFAWAFQDRGGTILEQMPVLNIEVSGGKVTGVRTPAGVISAATVISCAGPQTALLCGAVGVHVPVVSARLEAAITAPIPKLFDTAMVANGLSVRQTRRGNILFCGGPHEWIDVDLTSEPAKPATPVVQGESRRLLELLPGLANVALIRAWAGIVEVTPDHATLVERCASPEGLVVVSTSGHGIGLAPALGRAVSELALSEAPFVPIAELSLSRFRELDPNWAANHQWTVGHYNT